MSQELRVADVILLQLGGQRFVIMTGANHLLSDGNTLRMNLPKNSSGANRLYITLDKGRDTYIMRFFKYIAPHMNRTTYTFSEEKIIEIETYDNVYDDMLQDIFTQVTGLYTCF